MEPEPIDITKPGPLLTPDDMAQVFSLPSRAAVYAHVSRGQLPPPVALGTTRRWNRETVRDWIRRAAAGGAS